MKVFHIVCMVLMIAMMQHTCFADEQTEIIYGDGWTHYNYTGDTQAHKLAPTNYLRWDGEWRPKTELNLSSGDWSYLVEEFETYYLITRLDDSLTLSKIYRTYDFQPYKIGVWLTLTPVQLNGLSTYHNVGGTDYWYITIPQSLKHTSKHLNWDNKLPIISNENGVILNQSDNISGEWLPNYKYQILGGELRLYYNQVARSFGVASTEVTFDFNSYIINSSTNWANTSYSNFAYDRNTGYLILPDNVTDGLILYQKMSGSSGVTSYDMNETSDNNGTLINMNTGLDNGSSGWNSSGKYGNAIAFDGANTYVDNGDIDVFDSTTNFSVSLCYYATTRTNTNGQVLIRKYYDDDVSSHVNIDLQLIRQDHGTHPNEYMFTAGNGIGSHVYLFSGSSHVFPLNTWTNLTVQRNVTNMYIYENRIKIASGSISGATPASTDIVSLGAAYYQGSSSTLFNGLLDEVRMYNCELTNDEINQTTNNTMKNTDNVTHWHDAGSGYQTVSFVVNMTTPTNTNYTVWYADNGSSFSQIGGTYTGNQTPSISGTKYQNTDLRIVMNGNTTATPEEIEVTFVTETSAAAPNITSWQNNKTLNNTLDFTINISEEVNFNATANQTITTWNWYKDDVDQSYNYNNITLNWLSAGLKHVIINATNSNGTSSSIIWNVTVLDTEPEPTPAPVILVSPAQYDELDLPLILYILTISMLYLLIVFRHGVAAVELSLIYLIFAFFFLLFQTVTMSVNYIYLTLFLLVFIISIAGITLEKRSW